MGYFVKRFRFFLHPYVLVVIYLYGGKPKSIRSGLSYLKLVDYVFFLITYIYIYISMMMMKEMELVLSL